MDSCPFCQECWLGSCDTCTGGACACGAKGHGGSEVLELRQAWQLRLIRGTKGERSVLEELKGIRSKICAPCIVGSCRDCRGGMCVCGAILKHDQKANQSDIDECMSMMMEDIKESPKCGHCMSGYHEKCRSRCACSKNEHKGFEIEAMAKLWAIKMEKNRMFMKADHAADTEEFQGYGQKSGFENYIQSARDMKFAAQFEGDAMLPGYMYGGRASCGKWKVMGCLDKDLHSMPSGWGKKCRMSCNTKGCQVCFEGAIEREARALADRMVAFLSLKRNKDVFKQNPNRERIMLHTVVSVPTSEHEKFKTREGRKELRKMALNIIKPLDIDGGAMVDHPYRFGRGLASARLSPHFHLMHTGWIDGEVCAEIYHRTGWLVKQISNGESWMECYFLARYLLSHAGTYIKSTGKRSPEHTVRYFGECHNKKFKVATLLERSASSNRDIKRLLADKHEKTVKEVDLPFVGGRYSISRLKGSIKTIEYEVHDFTSGNFNEVRTMLEGYIRPYDKDNPAFSQSVPENFEGTSHPDDGFVQQRPSLEDEEHVILNIRLDYRSGKLEQSDYFAVFLDPSTEPLCPECSYKLKMVIPGTEWPDDISEKFAGEFKEVTGPFGIDVDIWKYRNEVFDEIGQRYLTDDGAWDYDLGNYSRPPCMEEFKLSISVPLSQDIRLQEFVAQYMMQNGTKPTPEEKMEFLHPKHRIASDNSHDLRRF